MNLADLGELRELRELYLGETQITNASIPLLLGHTQLRRLSLFKTLLSGAGMDLLEAGLPNCQVLR